MKPFTLALGFAVALVSLNVAGQAQEYPARSKIIKIVVPYPAGGPTDFVGRTVADALGRSLKKTVIVENKSGAGGTIGADSVAKSAGDGYTLLLTSSADAWNTALYDNLSFDYVRDIVPISGLAKGMSALAVNSTSPINSVPELIAFARSNPGKVNVGSGGVGTISHVAWAIFASLTGVKTVHVPYRGEGPAMADLLERFHD
jgi:tripartite-type tricarboxylate transporter receptor subunit TctC